MLVFQPISYMYVRAIPLLGSYSVSQEILAIRLIRNDSESVIGGPVLVFAEQWVCPMSICWIAIQEWLQLQLHRCFLWKINIWSAMHCLLTQIQRRFSIASSEQRTEQEVSSLRHFLISFLFISPSFFLSCLHESMFSLFSLSCRCYKDNFIFAYLSRRPHTERHFDSNLELSALSN